MASRNVCGKFPAYHNRTSQNQRVSSSHGIHRPRRSSTFRAGSVKGIEYSVFDQGRSVADLLTNACTRYSKLPAMACNGVTFSYSKLLATSKNFASYLQNHAAVKPGDRVAFMLPNLIQFPVAFMGTQIAGGVGVSINPQYTAKQLAHQVKDSGAKVLVILNLFLPRLQEVIDQLPNLEKVICVQVGDHHPFLKRFIVNTVVKRKAKKAGIPLEHRLETIAFTKALRKGAKLEPIGVQRTDEDICVLQYTGGTTGVSKGATLTQGSIRANIEQMFDAMQEKIGTGQSETIVTVLPLYHVFALTVNFLAMASRGVKNVLITKPLPVTTIIEAFKKNPDITIFTGVNPILGELLAHDEFAQVYPKNLRVTIAGGAALQRNIQEKWHALTGVYCNQGYGLSEASPVVGLNPIGEKDITGSAGIPLNRTDVKIIDSKTGQEEETGEIGEITLRGPQVMAGYWQRPEETSKVLKNGRLHTGDLGFVDSTGRVFIVDRLKDMILVSGENVYPNDVENALAGFPGVREIAAIGVPAGLRGEAVKVFIVPEDPDVLSNNEKRSALKRKIRRFALKQLSREQMPRHYEFRANLPKSNVGKVLRRELKEEELRNRQ